MSRWYFSAIKPDTFAVDIGGKHVLATHNFAEILLTRILAKPFRQRLDNNA